MNKLIIEILPTIEQVAKRTTRIPDNQNELIQYTVLECYKYEAKIKRLHNEGILNRWISATIFHEWIRIKKSEPIEQTKHDIEDTTQIDLMTEIQKKLSETERMWIKAYLKDGSYKAIAKRTKIDAESVSLRLKEIIEKCKTLRHTL